MNEWKNKTTEMIINKVEWQDISDKLGISPQSLLVWRNGESRERHRAIRLVLDSIIQDKNKGDK